MPRVFCLTTGRSGSLTFARAFTHTTNFSVDHESIPLSEPFGPRKLDFPALVYPDWHISSDSRLVWLAGYLSELYPDSRYVHLLRDREEVAASFDRRRWNVHEAPGAWRFGLHLFGDRIAADDCAQAAARMWDIVNANIRCFLAGRPHRTVWISDLADRLPELWNWIGAEGDLARGLQEAGIRHNREPAAAVL